MLCYKLCNFGFNFVVQDELCGGHDGEGPFLDACSDGVIIGSGGWKSAIRMSASLGSRETLFQVADRHLLTIVSIFQMRKLVLRDFPRFLSTYWTWLGLVPGGCGSQTVLWAA